MTRRRKALRFPRRGDFPMPPFPPPPPCQSVIAPDLIAGVCVLAALAVIGWLTWEVHRPDPPRTGDRG